MSRTERLFDLIQLLRTYHFPVTAARLAARLEVTVRTVYRDIATLQALGAPVDGEAGLGYVLRPGFLLPPLMFKDDELEAIVLGARWVMDRADTQLGQAARSALARIGAVLPARLRQDLEDSPLIVGPGRAFRDSDAELIKLRRAIRQQRKVSLRYRSVVGEITDRVIWPFALSFFNSVRIVVAWCELRQDYRSFRTDLIDQTRVLSESYPRHRSTLLKEWQTREGIRPGDHAERAADFANLS
jgi:predicted DNA-binding transcriptional regulator YafY